METRIHFERNKNGLSSLDNMLCLNQTQHLGTDKYRYVNTRQIVDQFIDKGWLPIEYREDSSYKRDGYQKHSLTLTYPSANYSSIDCKPIILVRNSFDARSSLYIIVGLLRAWCDNECYTGQAFGILRLRHLKFTTAYLNQLLGDIGQAADKVANTASKWHDISLHEGQKRYLAERVIRETQPKFIERINNLNVSGYALNIHKRHYFDRAIDDLLRTRRVEDRKGDLWTVYNRIQENCLRGGTRLISSNGSLIRTRPVKAIDSRQKINSIVWEQASQFAH